ncbi:MAG: hypothetical protein U9R53_08645 [Chloroflexota bacterium]|nr:hypothetical protein [Chloroflexota bacterium]
MGHIPEDENIDEFMNASAEEWSKPEEAPEVPEVKAESTDRWGSPTADQATVDSGDRWGSEPLEPTKIKAQPKKEKVKVKKNGSKLWIIAILAVIVLSICICVTVIGLSFLGYNLFDPNLLQF